MVQKRLVDVDRPVLSEKERNQRAYERRTHQNFKRWKAGGFR